jgi:hypothetical protein
MGRGRAEMLDEERLARGDVGGVSTDLEDVCWDLEFIVGMVVGVAGGVLMVLVARDGLRVEAMV